MQNVTNYSQYLKNAIGQGCNVSTVPCPLNEIYWRSTKSDQRNMQINNFCPIFKPAFMFGLTSISVYWQCPSKRYHLESKVW